MRSVLLIKMQMHLRSRSYKRIEYTQEELDKVGAGGGGGGCGRLPGNILHVSLPFCPDETGATAWANQQSKLSETGQNKKGVWRRLPPPAAAAAAAWLLRRHTDRRNRTRGATADTLCVLLPFLHLSYILGCRLLFILSQEVLFFHYLSQRVGHSAFCLPCIFSHTRNRCLEFVHSDSTFISCFICATK